MAVFRAEKGGQGLTVLAQLQRAGAYLPAPCGGEGRCGKCRVRFLFGAPEPTEAERRALDPARLRSGWRLACRAAPAGAFAVEYDPAETQILAEDGFIGKKAPGGGGSGRHAVAVDLGTTTIAAALVDADTGAVLDTRTALNRQRAFGADVISRIQAFCEGRGELMRRSVREDVAGLIRALGEDPDTAPVYLAGNTTMQHLMEGLDCRGLGTAPYTPVDIRLRTRGNITYLPGICTYVGADIAAGICACGMDESDGLSLLIDLGTNGEMAVGGRGGILAASTAAGPAFEGGNISCGAAGVPGAISGVRIEAGRAHCRTIGGGPPVGLCGTGVLETVYELLRAGLMDETGRLDPALEGRFPLGAGLAFTQADVRAVQLAKAAIRAGLETLTAAAGAAPEDLDRVYLAGGFGQKIDLKKAAGIGLIPASLIEKTRAVGNTSLAGAAAAVDPAFRRRLERTAERAREVSLAGSAAFADRYIESMLFDEEDEG